MDIVNKDIDGGKAFDWGRTSENYAKYRDIYPQEFYEALVSRGLCIKGQSVLDLGTGTGVIPRNMYRFGAEWTGSDISENQIEQAKLLAEKGVGSGEILLGARPEHIVLTDGPAENAIPCKLEVKEMMGSELHLHVVTEDETRWIVRVPTIDLNAEQRAHLEEHEAELFITFEGKAMHFFDPESEKNLIYGEE